MMTKIPQSKTFTPCAICGSAGFHELALNPDDAEQPMHVCRSCGNCLSGRLATVQNIAADAEQHLSRVRAPRGVNGQPLPFERFRASQRNQRATIARIV